MRLLKSCFLNCLKMSAQIDLLQKMYAIICPAIIVGFRMILLNQLKQDEEIELGVLR